MRTPATLWVVLISVLAGAGAYTATTAARSAATQPADAATDALMNWLGVPTTQRAQIAEHDPAFASDLRKLREELLARRADLAAALEKADTPAEAIQANVEAVLAANAAVERRATKYLLTVRDHLTPEQQRRLFGLCAQGLRQGQGMQWRHGQGGGGSPGRGLGPGGGRGKGAGAQ